MTTRAGRDGTHAVAATDRGWIRDERVRLSENLFRFDDTCNVYLIRSARDAVLVDFGSGDILDRLEQFGVDRVTDVLMTHHHRDQAQGLARAVDHGARIWVPSVEQDLFHSVAEHWQARTIFNNYNVRQDRFSLLESVPVTGTLPEYRAPRFGAHRFRVLPTPGHTVGSISFLARIDGRKVAFTGDLIYGPGKVWSLAATQWTYTGAEGGGASVLSLLDLRDRRPDVLLPSHGEPMNDPPAAIDLLVERFSRLFEFRGRHPDLLELRDRPFEPILPHLLSNRTSVANSYVLLSDSGKALIIDFGYDMTTGLAAGADRAARRPWLYSMAKLRTQHGVDRVDVAIPTHYHDDHLAGFNHLHDVLGTRIWVPVNFVDLLVNPSHYGLPCLWYDRIPCDRPVPLDRPIPWEEYELTFYELPGHTLYAVAIGFEVDGKRVLVTGDHQQDRWLNYTYQNRFRIGDFRDSADLYQRLQPELMVSGHWDPIWVDQEYLSDLATRGRMLERLHQELLPLDDVNFEAEGFGAWIGPYQSRIVDGRRGLYNVAIRNPFDRPEDACVEVVVPAGWRAEPARIILRLAPRETVNAEFAVVPPRGLRTRRARIAVDLTVADRRFGQQAEALVDVVGDGRQRLPDLPMEAEPAH